MCCVEKKVLIVLLVLLAIYFIYSLRIEKFNFDEYKKKLDVKPLDTKVIDVSVYNYNPIPVQCPSDSKEKVSWDPNTTICEKDNQYVQKECPKEMVREGDLCFVGCDSKYERYSGLCWQK
jgi:hypothetical protein